MFRGRLILTSSTGITLSDRFQSQIEERRLKAKERFEKNRQRSFNANRGLDVEPPSSRVRLPSGGAKSVTIVEPIANGVSNSARMLRRSRSSSSSQFEAWSEPDSWLVVTPPPRGRLRGRGRGRGGNVGSMPPVRGRRGAANGWWRSNSDPRGRSSDEREDFFQNAASLVGPSGRPRQLLRANSRGRGGGRARWRGYRGGYGEVSVFERLS